MKIAGMGYSGAGKSTLSSALSQRLGLPLLHLDKVQFTAGWQERDRAEALAMVEAFMAQSSWVIDGNYAGFLQARRLEEADLIVFLDLPRLTCLRQAWGRYRRFRGQVRESAADGCCEKFDLEFFRWLVWDGRSRKRSAQYRSLMARYSAKAVVLKNRAQIQSFLARFPASDPAAP